MRYHVHHETRYSFDAPVFLEPHAIRLRPRDGAGQRVARYGITIEPTPTVIAETLDLYGNVVTQSWFEGLTPSLAIDVDFEVETLRSNPFDFLLLTPATRPLPWPADKAIPPAYLAREAGMTANVDALAAEHIAAAEGVMGFLMSITKSLGESFTVDIREDGEPHPAERTLLARHGSCRDIAVLMVDTCRAAGIPARFVSGYQEGDPVQEHRDLHAWTEAYVPGAGWRGFDPTLGLAVVDRHIAVAAAPEPPEAAPVTGIFRGRARAILEHRIQLDVVG